MTSTSQPNQELTHVRADGSAHMVDVTEKSVTTRTALAEATVRTREDVIAMIFDADLPKGDALPVARVAGIMGAKRTPEIIPLCHPLPLGKITVDFERGTDFVRIEAVREDPRRHRRRDGGAHRRLLGGADRFRHD